MLHRHAAWRSTRMQLVHAALTCTLDMQQRLSVWTGRMNVKHANARICSMVTPALSSSRDQELTGILTSTTLDFTLKCMSKCTLKKSHFLRSCQKFKKIRKMFLQEYVFFQIKYLISFSAT
jgi:hypothetical protein